MPTGNLSLRIFVQPYKIGAHRHQNTNMLV